MNSHYIEKWMVELAPVSRNNVKNVPSRRQSILQYIENSISILCGASILRYRYHLAQLYFEIAEIPVSRN